MERYATPDEFRRMANEAEKRGDNKFMAFAALQLPRSMREDAFRLLDHAVANDPSLTWMNYFVVTRYMDDCEKEPTRSLLLARIDKLQGWDPSNAAPHVLRASIIEYNRREEWAAAGADQSKIATFLSKQLEWQKAMESAFAQPRYDSYAVRRFELERKVLLEHGWDHPVIAASLMADFRLPNLLRTRDYANLLVQEKGASAEAAGQMDKALSFYRQAARFGERLHVQSQLKIEDLVGIALQLIAYEKLVPALKKAGKPDEAAQVDYARLQIRRTLDLETKNPLVRTANRAWSVVLMDFSASLTWVFGILTLACVVYVNGKRWVRREKKGRIYELATVAENYVVLLCFVGCVGLYLAYMPYAQNFSHYMSDPGPFPEVEHLVENSPTTLTAPPFLRRELPLEGSLGGYTTYVMAGLAVLFLASVLAHWRAKRKARTAPAAAS
jgi:tetratricopeptide (TPR) repeat protein